MQIVCMGDALIDFNATGPLTFQGFVGGSPLNVAVAAARLETSVGFASQISGDQFGRAIRAHLHANRVDTGFLLESNAPSTLAFVSEQEGEAVFDFIATRSADVCYDPRPRQRFPDTVRMVQFGSISLLQEPAATTLTDTVAAHQGRAIIVFDPNVRPALIADKTRYETRLRRDWLPISDIVKVSAQDLRWLYPGIPYAEVARDWLAYGPAVVIVTDGANGVTRYSLTQTPLHIPTPRVTVADTVGAGDTFTGALMVRLLTHPVPLDPLALGDADWRDALAYAAAAAALNCTRRGADPPHKEALEAFISRNLGR